MVGGRAGDMLGGPADVSRPSNPWPRILAFALVVAAGIGLSAMCVASFASPPPRQVRIPVANLQPGVPVFSAITTFGNDRQRRTYGVWTSVDAGGRTSALLSRSAATSCHIRWDATAKAGEVSGVYVDPCGPGRWSLDGHVVDGSAAKDMEAFRTTRERDHVSVDLTHVLLGDCRTANASACSPAGAPLERAVPNGALPPDFATK